jgi:hypothetical protein
LSCDKSSSTFCSNLSVVPDQKKLPLARFGGLVGPASWAAAATALDGQSRQKTKGTPAGVPFTGSSYVRITISE